METVRGDQPLLSISGLSKAFPGALALNDVDFDVGSGEIHALLGQNGAGKSTLIKILAGAYGYDRGEIRLSGSRVEPATMKLPINFIHQDLGLVESTTVAENIAIAVGFARRRGLIDWSPTGKAATNALALMTDDIDPDRPVSELSAAERSIVAIARALATKCAVPRRRPRGFLRRLDLQGVTGRGAAIRRLARSGELPYRPPSARRLRRRNVNAGFPPSLPVANLPLEPQPGGSG